MKRVTFATLSTKNLENNFRIIKSFSNESSVIAMVKANAYGHGIRGVSRRLESFGVNGLGVARIDEALALREIGIKTKIILMEGIFSKEELMLASVNNFDIVFHSSYQIDLLCNNFYLPKKINAWFKIDSGMSRLGFRVENDQEFDFAFSELKRLCLNSKIESQVVLISHLASASKKENDFNSLQFKLFEKFYDFVCFHQESILCSYSFLRSFCNSAAIFNFPETHFDFVRPGISLYGYSSISSKKTIEIGLRPVMTLCAEIIAIKIIDKGSYVGYNNSYKCLEKTRIAIISVGYGDGYSASFSNSSYILGPGMKKFPVIGSVSMDMIAVNINEASENDIKIGDIVILFGDNLVLEELFETNNVIQSLNPYTVLTSLQNRVKCYWVD